MFYELHDTRFRCEIMNDAAERKDALADRHEKAEYYRTFSFVFGSSGSVPFPFRGKQSATKLEPTRLEWHLRQLDLSYPVSFSFRVLSPHYIDFEISSSFESSEERAAQNGTTKLQ